jgi:hypothetical protein
MTDRSTLTCEEIRDLAPLFVTGALDPGEMDAVREHLAGCDDAHAELIELGEAAAALLETAEPAEPPAALRSRLLAAAEADLVEGRHPSQPPASVAPLVPFDRVRERRRTRLAWLLAAAAIVVAVALGAWNVALRGDLSNAQAYRTGVEQALDLAGQPGSVTALLAAKDGSVSGFGVVGADGTVRLAMRGLAPTTGSQVYTAWSIEGDAPPVAIGEFTVGSDGVAVATARAPTAAPGVVLALTLEPVPGATAPAGPVVASGVTRDPAG